MNGSKIRGAFSDLEHAIMEIVWRHGSATAEIVRDDLQPNRPLKESTVRTLLRRLEDKGHLRHRVDGRTFIYSAAESPGNLAVRAVRQIIDRFCSGSVEQLLVGMVGDDLIDPAELRKLADKVAKSRKKAAAKRAGK